MKKMSYAEAIREAMSIRMREDPNVLLFGEDVGAFGGCFGVSAGMFDEFGEKRVRDQRGGHHRRCRRLCGHRAPPHRRADVL